MDAHQQQIRDEKLGQWEPIIDQCLKECEEYGSKTRWCKAHDISTSSFFYWLGIVNDLRGIPRKTKPREGPVVSADDFVDVTPIVNSYDPSGQHRSPDQKGNGTADAVPEIMVDYGKCRIYLYSSVHRENLAMLAEVLHVC